MYLQVIEIRSTVNDVMVRIALLMDWSCLYTKLREETNPTYQFIAVYNRYFRRVYGLSLKIKFEVERSFLGLETLFRRMCPF